MAVIRFLQEQQYEILQHRFQTPFAEIDLLIQGKKNQLVILEVKARSGRLNDQPVISEFQKKRLRRSALWFIGQGYEVELWLATVDHNQQIQFFQDVFD